MVIISVVCKGEPGSSTSTISSSTTTMVRSPKCFGGCCKTLNEGLDSWSTNLTFLGLNESMPIGMSTMFCAHHLC